jgi:UDPglucose--hexose-1-phosphate uridylyltransferase
MILEHEGWQVVAQHAAVFPVALSVEPLERVADLPSMGPDTRDALAHVLVDVLGRLDRLHDQSLPYMMWLHQAPSGEARVDGEPWFQVEIVSPWRAAGVPRFIAAAEVACEEYFNPVAPEDVAARLRAL